MRRVLALAVVLVALAACGDEPERFRFPDEPQGRLLTPSPGAATGPAPAATTYDVGGCPAPERRMCQEASAIANALSQASTDALLPLTRTSRVACADVDEEAYPQCEDERSLEGYVVAGAEDETFVIPADAYEEQLAFLRDGLDTEYSDEYGTGAYRILGVATCEAGERYQLIYVVALGDPESTIPADRFLGALELSSDGRTWAVSRFSLDILSDWQLYYDDPLADLGCGRIDPWRV